MRSRYHPDGSVDDEADRMLEILRHADQELDRLRREESHAPSTTSKAAVKSPLAQETLAMLIEPPKGLKPLSITDYMNLPNLTKP